MLTSITLCQKELHAVFALPRRVGAALPPPQLVPLVVTQPQLRDAYVPCRAAHACLGVRVAGHVVIRLAILDIGVDVAVVGCPACRCHGGKVVG